MSDADRCCPCSAAKRVAGFVALTLLLSVFAFAQRRPAVTRPAPCTAFAINQSADWRSLAFAACETDPDDLRCWRNAVTGEPLWNQENAGCRRLSTWLAQPEGPNREGDYVKWLAREWVAARDRGEDPGFDVPAPQCMYHGYRFDVAEGVTDIARSITFRVADARDPLAFSFVSIPAAIDTGDERGVIAWPGSGSFYASFRGPCLRHPQWVIDVPGITITSSGKIAVTANE